MADVFLTRDLPVPDPVPTPAGFRISVGNAGVKDSTDDVTVIAADGPCTAAAVFTRSRFAGPSVVVSRAHAAGGSARAVVVVSKNANVATGAEGMANARELAARTAAVLGCDVAEVLVASTGVIGRPYPMDRLRAYFNGLAAGWPGAAGADVLGAARGIMTTDTVPKVATAALHTLTGGQAVVSGMAKGVGMIEPDMATMLTFVLTDAFVPGDELDAMWRRVVNRTFNCVSIDSDTSTSDTAVVLASGVAGAVDAAELERALEEVCRSLTIQVAQDGEGATKLLTVVVHGARDDAQAKRVAKAVVNSPLVKTAVHGADPNWGRVAMAIGKCSDEADIDQQRVTISFGDKRVYPEIAADEASLARLTEIMSAPEVTIGVGLGLAAGTATVWGCDLSDGYVRINADYTT